MHASLDGHYRGFKHISPCPIPCSIILVSLIFCCSPFGLHISYKAFFSGNQSSISPQRDGLAIISGNCIDQPPADPVSKPSRRPIYLVFGMNKNCKDKDINAFFA